MPFQQGRDNLVILAIVAVLGVVAWTGFRRLKSQQEAVDCLGRLEACPHGAGHLPTTPVFEGRQLRRQSFPAATSLAIPGWASWSRLDATPAGPQVSRQPRFWWRFVVGPLLQLLGLAALLLLLANLVIEWGRRPRIVFLLLAYPLLLLLVGLLTWGCIRSVWSRETWTFEPATRTVRHQAYLAGLAWGGPAVYAVPRALAPVRGSRTTLVLVPRDGRPVPLFDVAPDALGALAPVCEAVLGP